MLEEQKSKEEEERMQNPDIYFELQKMREELHGPFFTKEENSEY